MTTPTTFVLFFLVRVGWRRLEAAAGCCKLPTPNPLRPPPHWAALPFKFTL